ncbi:hypothetical protein [uncultured Tessaracoccus sp.]|uniref:hypothetical protein n=1 Tax=uncultured Tessaracoccus sp. TaxID=905023 RepID=UPI0025E0F8F6|nr:hypothetical protein [uncultured Tessaracoccus sp.]
MSYRFEPVAGTFDPDALAEQDLTPTFETRERAEAWLTEYYEELVEEGVTEVTLMEEDRVVYGPMSLLA